MVTTFSEAILGADGSESAPEYAFSGTTNTGMFRSGSQIHWSVSGTSRMLLNVNSQLDLIRNSSGGIVNTGNIGNDWTANTLTLSKANSGATNQLGVNYSSDTASSVAAIRASVGGAGAGDAQFEARVGGGANWTWGTDNSNSDQRVLAASQTLGSQDAMRVTNVSVPVITYTTTHPTGTSDYVCEGHGRHESETFVCCSAVEWHDDVGLALKAIVGEEWAIDQMTKIGVMERTFNNEGEPEVLTKLGMDVAFAWAMAGQNRQRMDAQHAELHAAYEELDRCLVAAGL